MPKSFDVEFNARAARGAPDHLDDRVGAFATMRARTWVAYQRSLGRRGEQLPADLADHVARVAAFADDVLGGSPADGRWVAASRTWTTTT
ncbi:MAG: hypothetical protein HHJ10_08985 [Cellulomonas sp.]|uniref:hypothetical protein n=1 Tax=Cellulomonas sp. TaxID=40001 RepID=UPI0017EF5434|nr:hypothetical protein [Cellulomonas sp.]NMM31157.1 hypothetical protein [Cellulomonas sp.]